MDIKSLISSVRLTPNILSHWYSLYEKGQFSSASFYDSIEAELQERKLPQLKASRPEFHEGSLISDKRVYLRLERERYAFDVCAAPFGTGYFFSLRLVEKPRSLFALFALMFGGMIMAMFLARYGFFAVVLGMGALVCAFSVYVVRIKGGPVTPGDGFDLDSFLLNTALIGAWYERVRRDTYFRYDTRLLFQSIIPGVVKKKAEEIMAKDGVTLLEAYEYEPVLKGAYTAVKIGEKR